MNATSLTSWIKAIKITLDRQDINSAALFAQAGLDIHELANPNARYPLANTTRLWQLAVQATGDENLGLNVARNINQTTFHALGYSLLASHTLEEAFERLIRYFRIVSDAAELDFQPSGDDYKFIIRLQPGEVQPANEALDAMMSVVIRLCRALYGKHFRASEIRLRRPAPQDETVFNKVFQAPIAFGADEAAMYISRLILRAPLPSANAELARHNDEILARHIARFDKVNVANRVHATLLEQLSQGEPSQEKIAGSLHMSLRNLQRKLSAEKTSYKEILNRTRHELALSYIAEPRYSISEITYLLGFSDTSSFTRAFKRWTGQSPSHYRQQL